MPTYQMLLAGALLYPSYWRRAAALASNGDALGTMQLFLLSVWPSLKKIAAGVVSMPLPRSPGKCIVSHPPSPPPRPERPNQLLVKGRLWATFWPTFLSCIDQFQLKRTEHQLKWARHRGPCKGSDVGEGQWLKIKCWLWPNNTTW